MTFIVQGEVSITSEEAKARMTRLRGELGELKSAAGKMSSEGQKGAREISKMGKAAAGAAGAVDTLADQERQAAVAVANMGRSHALAAGQLGNLTAQFNDIGVMLAAGQNPLQLAIQQGTQITQVIGPLGATGAVRALGSAFVSLLSPVNLVTIGSIAGGAALIQWLTDAGEEAADLEDSIEAAGAAIKAFGEQSDLARLSIAGMFAEFGTADPVLKAVLQDLAALGKIKAYEAIDQTAVSLLNLLGISDQASQRSAQVAARDFLGLNDMRRSAREAAAEFAYFLQLLASAEDPALKLQAALNLRSQLVDVTGGIDGMNKAQKEFFHGLSEIIRDMTLLQAKVTEVGTAFGTSLAQAAIHALDLGGHITSIREGSITMQSSIQALPGTLQGSAQFALSLADQIWRAASGVANIVGQAASQGRQEVYSGRGRGPTMVEIFQMRHGFTEEPSEPRRSGGGGGGGSINAERQALERLIAQERLQLEILRETDPVMKEMLRYREALAGATDAERREVEALIGVRVAETEALSQAAEQRQFFEDTTRQAFRGLITDGESLNDVLKNVASSLADAALQAALFGDGPFGGLFGGGLLGGLFGGRSASRAASVAARPSAALAARGGSASPAARGGPGTVNVSIDMRGSDGQNVEEVAYRGTVRALGEYDRSVLPARVREINRRPWRDG